MTTPLPSHLGDKMNYLKIQPLSVLPTRSLFSSIGIALLTPHAQQFRALVYTHMELLKIVDVQDSLLQVRYVWMTNELVEERISRDGQHTLVVYTEDNLEELQLRISMLEHHVQEQKRKFKRNLPLDRYLFGKDDS